MKKLFLNLKKPWFYMILSGEKKEEYREIKPYWCSRLLLVNNIIWNQKQWEYHFNATNESNSKTVEDGIKVGILKFRDYNTIHMAMGMHPPVPTLYIKTSNISIGTGKKEWGAEKDTKYFVLKLNDIISSENT